MIICANVTCHFYYLTNSFDAIAIALIFVPPLAVQTTSLPTVIVASSPASASSLSQPLSSTSPAPTSVVSTLVSTDRHLPSSMSSLATYTTDHESSLADVSPPPRHPMTTCLQANKTFPKQFTDGTVCYNLNRRAFFTEPITHLLALSNPTWRAATEAEYASLQHNCTWTLVPRPPGVNIVGSKWVFKLKQHSNGSIDKHKARLIARGFSQQFGVDY